MDDLKVYDRETAEGIVFGSAAFRDHEQVVFCSDPETGLRAIIGIHNTVLGPALGGTRMWDYRSDEEALKDVLRLSRGMTYKASISGLQLGGGKAVIMGDSHHDKTPALMRKFGAYVDSLSGRYITAEDVGINTSDMEQVKSQTDHVTGIPVEMGGSGDPSPVTAYGVYMAMKAAAKFKYGSDSLTGKRVLVQGIGHVGEVLVSYLAKEGADIVINDIYPDRTKRVAQDYGASIYEGSDFAQQAMDIYAPCALGATLNPNTIKSLQCSIVAGAANNQLAQEDRDGRALKKRGILYAPDFLINAGGLINVYSEIAPYSRAEALQRTENIFDTSLKIFHTSEAEDLTPHDAALKIAEERIAQAARS